MTQLQKQSEDLNVLKCRIEKLESAISAGKTIMTFKQVQQYLGFSKSYLYRLCYRKKIPYYQPLGKMIFFEKHELDEWVCRRGKSFVPAARKTPAGTVIR